MGVGTPRTLNSDLSLPLPSSSDVQNIHQKYMFIRLCSGYSRISRLITLPVTSRQWNPLNLSLWIHISLAFKSLYQHSHNFMAGLRGAGKQTAAPEAQARVPRACCQCFSVWHSVIHGCLPPPAVIKQGIDVYSRKASAEQPWRTQMEPNRDACQKDRWRAQD